MKVLVTGAACAFAHALLPALCEAGAVKAVTGVDARPHAYTHAKYRGLAAGLDDDALAASLPVHDALVHLVSCTNGFSATVQECARVRAAHKLFHAARAAGVRRLVHVSSASVYGPVVHADERAPLRPLAGFAYAEGQAHLERLLAIDFPECVRLRPHLIVGRGADPRTRRVLRQPFYPRLPDPQPLFQCVHGDDLAAAVLLALEHDARGPFNIAAEDGISLRDAIRARHALSCGVSVGAARGALRIAARVLDSGLGPVWLERASHTLLINCRRAASELGWRARLGAREAIAAT